MQLFLEALDVWLFRDGRPFDAGRDHRARSLFPPYPSVVLGAVRSHQLTLRGVDLTNPTAIRDAVGDAEDLRGLRLRGPFLARREGGGIHRYLPLPADAVTVDQAKGLVRRAASPRPPDASVITSTPTPMLLGLDDNPGKGIESGWLREDRLRDYSGRAPVAAVPSDDLFVRESRIGIGIDGNRRTARDGAIYEVEFIRPHRDVGLLVEVEGDGYERWPSEGVLRIGGEGRAARITRVEAQVMPWPSAPDPLPRRFRLYVATPAYFDGGWRPTDDWWSDFFDGDIRLVAAAIGRYESVGGRDWTKRGDADRPARRYVPAGSVYYFESDGRARLTVDAISDDGGDRGFGQILIEGW
jgi:CRISPR-associated protein Cmr3